MTERHPSDYPRRTLLATIGMTPSVLTETLWALAHSTESEQYGRARPFIPTEIHCVTTIRGSDQLVREFIEGHWLRSYADYHGHAGLADTFGQESILIVEDDGVPLTDIQTAAHNELLADRINDLARILTSDPEAAVHVSLAGGRKTMTFLGGYILSLHARPQDRLSHVLVNADLEIPGFYFPEQEPREIEFRGKTVDARTARIMLADIPFVRLKRFIGNSGPTMSDRKYSETVAHAQKMVDPPNIVLDFDKRRLTCQGVPVEFGNRVQLFAFAAYLAARIRSEDDTEVAAIQYAEFAHDNEQTALLETMIAATEPHRRRDLRDKIEMGEIVLISESTFENRVFRVNKLITEHLGELAPRYLIESFRKEVGEISPTGRIKTAKGFRLEPGQISFVGAEGEWSE